jgi:hypothetical protein
VDARATTLVEQAARDRHYYRRKERDDVYRKGDPYGHPSPY